MKPLKNYLFEHKNSAWFLITASAILLLGMLGAKDLWTQEWRWANVCHEMFIRHDFLHPYLENKPYYDKPLLSYWFMLATSFVTGFNIWAIRIPSVIAAFVSLWSTYYLGAKLITKQAGIIAAWLLLTTFYFVFWGRIGSADMLNVAGILLALVWYFARREQPGFVTYFVFFFILVIAALTKGLIAPAIVAVALIPELLRQNNWLKHFRWSFFFAVIPAVALYILPFWASSYFNGHHYAENGLFLVFRENVVRYFEAFDHKGPIYTYFLYLPIYTLPWIFVFIPALFKLPKRWSFLSHDTKWIYWATLLIFIFLTASSSRRSYYILPLVPFAILICADWIVDAQKRQVLIGKLIGVFYVLMVLVNLVLIPIAYSDGGVPVFAAEIKQEAIQQKPWQDWKLLMIKAENRTAFYLDSKHSIKFVEQPQIGDPDQIIIMNKKYLPQIDVSGYKIIKYKPNLGERLLKKRIKNESVGLIPVGAQHVAPTNGTD